MFRRLSTFLLIVSMAFMGMTLAQNKKVSPKKSNRDFIYSKYKKGLKNQTTLRHSSTSRTLRFNKVNGLIDTLSYRKWSGEGADWTNTADGFGHGAQDVMVQWYKASADLYVKAVGIGTATNENNQPASVKLVKLINYTDQDIADLGNAGSAGSNLGYYPGDGDGYNNVAPYENDNTGAASGEWVSVDDNPIPFEDLWSDIGFGIDIIPTPYPYEDNGYDWVVMMDALNFEPTVKSGEIFGISVSNTGNSPSTASVDGDRQSFWAQYGEGFGLSNPLLKFYEYERTADASDYGWWVRPGVLDFVAIVDIFGDEIPQIADVTSLGTTLSTDARTVEATITDRNPGGGDAGVQSATLRYSVDGGSTWNDVAMTDQGGDVYTGDIPGQASGTVVDYFVEAVDVGSNTNQSAIYEYRIFQATPGINTLLVLNSTFEYTEGAYPDDYYYGVGDFVTFATLDFDHDRWGYGELTTELLNSYTNVLEITTYGPVYINSDAVREWLEADGSRNYMLAGDEWMGAQSGWPPDPVPHTAGEFHFDILGINTEYNDINYGVDGDQLLPSTIYPQMGTLLGGPVYDLHAQVSSDSGWTAPMAYDPVYEVSAANWLDGVDFESDVEVDFQGMGADSNMYNIGGHRTLSGGNKIAFLAFDPLSLNSDAVAGVEYYWYGFSAVSPQVEVLNWFGANVVDVKKANNVIPDQYSLSQNYPNPFNPTTLINYNIPNAGRVTLAVYDLLGKKVSELVNTFQQAGSYNVTWDGTNQLGTKVTSGAYFYQLKTDNGFIETKKMILLK
jgi:hypothetical protein